MADTFAVLTDVAAWVGAASGLAAFGWDVYKWRKRGANLHVEIAVDMVEYDPIRKAKADTTWVIVTVANRGEKPTTITHLVGEHYTSLWQRLRRKPATGLFISQRGLVGQGWEALPHVLAPGARWSGHASQAELEPYLEKGTVRLGVAHSDSNNPVYRWLSIPKHRAAKNQQR